MAALPAARAAQSPATIANGIVLHDGMRYVLTPADPSNRADIERVQVVAPNKEMLTGTLVGVITDPDMDGVASGAMFGGSPYVNNARYTTLPEPGTEYWITRLNIKSVQP